MKREIQSRRSCCFGNTTRLFPREGEFSERERTGKIRYSMDTAKDDNNLHLQLLLLASTAMMTSILSPSREYARHASRHPNPGDGLFSPPCHVLPCSLSNSGPVSYMGGVLEKDHPYYCCRRSKLLLFSIAVTEFHALWIYCPLPPFLRWNIYSTSGPLQTRSSGYRPIGLLYPPCHALSTYNTSLLLIVH